MNRKLVLALTLTLLIGMLNVAFNVQKAKASGTIYIRADGSVDPPTAPITTEDNVTYVLADNIHDSIVVERDNIVVDGGGYTVTGSGSGNGITLTDRSNVRVRNMTIKNFYSGIWLSYSSNSTLSGNNVANNEYGIWLYSSSNNRVFHNSFVNNAIQVYTVGSNTWDDGFPFGGNYWSDYNGADSNHDGIGDSNYTIDASNVDRYPLMGMFYSINITFLPGSTVTLISNSTISFFKVVTLIEDIEPEASDGIPTVLINFTDQTGFGFCRVSIPHALMNISNTPVTIDHGFTTVLTPNYMLYDNGTQRWIYLAYEQTPPPLNQTSHFPARIMIIPEFPSFLILPLFMIATLLAVIVYRRCKVN